MNAPTHIFIASNSLLCGTFLNVMHNALHHIYIILEYMNALIALKALKSITHLFSLSFWETRNQLPFFPSPLSLFSIF